jgi:TolB-like protein/Flp pilus assembly protein TadD
MVKQASHIYEFGPFRLDSVKRLLLRDRQVVSLAPKVFETLLILVQYNGQIVEKDELIRLIWPNTFVEEANLTQHVFTLRKLLGKTADGRQYIATVPKRGYRFAPVDREIQDASTDVEVKLPHTTRPGPKEETATDLQDGPILSLAILPMSNASHNADLEYLSDGITESIINILSQLPQLRIIARNTTFQYKGQEIDVKEVGRDLGVRVVVMGRVQIRSDMLNIQVELINAVDGSQFWGDQYRRPISDIIVIQEEIARKISDTLKLKLTREERHQLSNLPPSSLESYRLYLLGRYYQNKYTEEGMRKGVEYLQRAIIKEPNFAQAYAALSVCYALGGLPLDPKFALAYAEMMDRPAPVDLPPREAMSKAKAAAIMALEIDNKAAEAHAALGFTRYRLDWDWPAAEIAYRRAIELNPNYATAHHWYSMCLRTMGRLDEALEEAKLARELDPLMLIINVELGRIFYFAREYNEAIKHYRKTLEMDPYFPPAHYHLGQAYEQKCMYEEAIVEFQQANSLVGDNQEAVAALGHVYALSGKRDEACRILDKLKELSIRRYISPYDIALLYVGLGEKDNAFEWLQNAYADRSVLLIGLKVEPMLDSLRSDPRFTHLMQRVGLA